MINVYGIKVASKIVCLIIICSFCITSSLWADNIITGTVFKVADGDTLKVFDSYNRVHIIRLYGIDAPELDQEYGQAAKKYLNDLTYNKHVTVNIIEYDRYYRKIGIVKIGNTIINEQLISGGHAWLYDEYCYREECKDWKYKESIAKQSKVNIWSGNNAKPPWDHRKKPSDFVYLKRIERFNNSATNTYHSEYGGSGSTLSGGRVHVQGYYRSDGAYVQPHTRSYPSRSR